MQLPNICAFKNNFKSRQWCTLWLISCESLFSPLRGISLHEQLKWLQELLLSEYDSVLLTVLKILFSTQEYNQWDFSLLFMYAHSSKLGHIAELKVSERN